MGTKITFARESVSSADKYQFLLSYHALLLTLLQTFIMGQFILTDEAVKQKLQPEQLLTNEDFNQIVSSDEIIPILSERGRDIDKILLKQNIFL